MGCVAAFINYHAITVGDVYTNSDTLLASQTKKKQVTIHLTPEDARNAQRVIDLHTNNPYFRPEPRRSKYNHLLWYEYKDGPIVHKGGGHYEQQGNLLLDKDGGEKCNLRQGAMIRWEGPEGFFGGKKAGGKSAYIAMDALRYFDVPGYTAIILRRTWAELSMGTTAIIPLLKKTLYPFMFPSKGKPSVVYYEKDHAFRSVYDGGCIQLAHAETEKDIERFAGIESQRAYFDELCSFTEYMYDYFISGMRRPSDGAISQVPIVVRGTGNPLGVGYEFVKNRFVQNPTKERIFMQSSLQDNPFIDRKEYQKQRGRMSDVLARKLFDGDWEVQFTGGILDPNWFEIIPKAPPCKFWVRPWDIAGTVPTDNNPDPDWTVSVPMGITPTKDIIIDLTKYERFRVSRGEVERKMEWCMDNDGERFLTVVEQQPGAAGKSEADRLSRKWVGRKLRFVETGGKSKEERAESFAAYAFCKEAKEGRVKIVASKHTEGFLNRISMFGQKGVHDDDVDSLSLGFRMLCTLTASSRKVINKHVESMLEKEGKSGLLGLFRQRGSIF